MLWTDDSACVKSAVILVRTQNCVSIPCRLAVSRLLIANCDIVCFRYLLTVYIVEISAEDERLVSCRRQVESMNLCTDLKSLVCSLSQ